MCLSCLFPDNFRGSTNFFPCKIRNFWCGTETAYLQTTKLKLRTQFSDITTELLKLCVKQSISLRKRLILRQSLTMSGEIRRFRYFSGNRTTLNRTTKLNILLLFVPFSRSVSVLKRWSENLISQPNDKVYNTERKYGTLPGGNPAKWYHYISQLLFQICIGFCGMTSFIFWFWEFRDAKMNFYAVLDIHVYLMPSKYSGWSK